MGCLHDATYLDGGSTRCKHCHAVLEYTKGANGSVISKSRSGQTTVSTPGGSVGTNGFGRPVIIPPPLPR